ncbi:hypothetical protein [Granulicella sp. dw_53]|uniref:DUF3592 domain-containing protein n=1 Tax=Granulicella sp. dw_53 TaxID=2719792 RepID=UPI001BD537DC|nr:hypothetical protein [Granulicella sp. dw_53]
MFPDIPTHLPLFLRSPRNILAVGFGIAVAAGVTSYVLTRRQPTPDEIERARRDLLALTGRITDGSITETQWLIASGDSTPSDVPAVLVYSYVIAGVTYECAQDVSALEEHVRHVRVDLPIQVRFDPRNPANSIVVAESWSGLRLGASYPPGAAHPDPLAPHLPPASQPNRQSTPHSHA